MGKVILMTPEQDKTALFLLQMDGKTVTEANGVKGGMSAHDCGGSEKPRLSQAANCLRNFSYKIDYFSFWLMQSLIAYALWYIFIHFWISSFLNYPLISWQEQIRNLNQSFWNLKISDTLLHLINLTGTSAQSTPLPKGHHCPSICAILAEFAKNSIK